MGSTDNPPTITWNHKEYKNPSIGFIPNLLGVFIHDIPAVLRYKWKQWRKKP